MRSTILDTSFILTCVRQKIDFFEEIPLMGIQIIIPKQVIEEIRGLAKSEKQVEIVLKLLEKNKFKKISLETKNVDEGLIKYSKKDKNIIIATLDREIKKKVQNSKLIIRGKKKLEVV